VLFLYVWPTFGNNDRDGKEPSVKVRVDPNLCAGVSACEATCPEVFEVRGGRSFVKVDVVPPELEEKCREAVEGCPMGAISIE
jgi:ferredoxin